MSQEIKHGKTGSHGDYERRDLSSKAIIYFLLILAVSTILVHFLLAGMYDFLDKRERAQQPAVSPLSTNVETDTRKLPENYKSYLKDNFPAPQLEVDERTQLNGIRLTEEQTLNSYGWVDEKAGTVRIPIDRAMDLIAQRGLPVVSQGAAAATAPPEARKPAESKKKGNKR
jgi:hypothetical protein